MSDCCLDLDYNAKNTIGNAYETTAWAKALGYKHIILVTSAYHMPRAEIQMGATTSQIKITPFPVFNQTERKWYLVVAVFHFDLQLLSTYLHNIFF